MSNFGCRLVRVFRLSSFVLHPSDTGWSVRFVFAMHWLAVSWVALSVRIHVFPAFVDVLFGHHLVVDVFFIKRNAFP